MVVGAVFVLAVGLTLALVLVLETLAVGVVVVMVVRGSFVPPNLDVYKAMSAGNSAHRTRNGLTCHCTRTRGMYP